MLHALIAGLFVVSSYAGQTRGSRGGGSYSGQSRSSLKQYETSCYTDADCDNNEQCNDGICETEATICYGDDECRGRQVCDMGSYICVDPTPSPIWTTPSPTEPAGCCYGDSYKANDKCLKATDRQRCEDMGCSFMETDNPEDCEMTTTSTTSSTSTTPAPGCCYGDSYKANGKCMMKLDQDRCINAGCFWQETDNPEDCEMTTTTTTTSSTTPAPTEYFCCYGDTAASNEMCAAFNDDADKCDARGQCELRVGEDADCTFTPTTTTEEVGCCKGATARNADMCAEKDTADLCSRSNKCVWLKTDDPNDCVYTTTSEAPGCCHGDGYKSNDRCLKATDQGRCEANGCTWLETDEPKDCEMTTTTSTTTTEAPGCCRAIPTMATMSHNENCLKRDSEGLCARGSACEWLVTDNDDDCLFTTTTTTTTTEEPGCCKGNSPKANPMCNARLTRDICERSSSCEFISGGELEKDCVVDSTTTVPGCCYINPDIAYSNKYQTTCTSFSNERDCLKLTDSNGVPRCVFEELVDGYDCSLLWPTTTTTTIEPGCCKGSSYKNQAKCLGFDNREDCERRGCEFVSGGEPEDCIITTTSTTTTSEPVGCCKGDTPKTNTMCNGRTSKTQCERSSSCHFVEDGVLEVDCVLDSTTIEPGCCYINPDAAYNNKWQDTCTGYFTERDCLKMSDSDGVARCAWEPLGDYMDCEMLWPTTTTTTEEPGCCRGFSYKAQAKCLGLDNEMMCDKKGCEWVFTEDDSECDLTTTTTTSSTTTTEPGCCKGDSPRTNDRCNKMETADKCDRSSSCTWVSFGDLDSDCAVDSTTIEPGCCYINPDAAYSKRWQDSCTAFYTERDCLQLTNGDGEPRCAWESLGEGYDCAQLWPTTTTTTEEPGCCRGYSYKAQAKCLGLEDQIACERKDCEWFLTDDANDCVLTTETPTTTTTTEEPAGCCKADSARHVGMCDMKDTEKKCSRSSSCHWIVTEDPSDCDIEETTTTEPGCCYGNPDIAYSARWMESCKGFFTQRDCEMLTNGDGEARCVWEPLGDGYDCAQLWPTTTTTTVEPGCCYGDSEASNAMCAAFDEDPDKCETRSQCEFRAGEDADCTFTPTTTTEEVGCCKGKERKNADMCFEKEGRTQCERSGKCEFVVTDDDEECQYDTTTSSPWLNAKSETNSYSSRRSSSSRRGRNNNQMLFGGADGESVVANAMQTQVSLSTVLLFVLAAFALHQAYACVANRRNAGYKHIETTASSSAYQQTV